MTLIIAQASEGVNWLLLFDILAVSGFVWGLLGCSLAAFWPREKGTILTGGLSVLLGAGNLCVGFRVRGCYVADEWGLPTSPGLFWALVIGPLALGMMALAIALIRRMRA